MKVKRIICPSCKSEERVVSDEHNLRNYSEDIVSEVCGEKVCQEWNTSPEQKLLRAMFGERK